MLKKDVKVISVGVLTAEQIALYSACEVTKPYTQGSSFENTPYDRRLGSLEKDIPCKTCQEKDCIGHPGHIALLEPIYNPQFITGVIRILNCVCPSCSKLRIPRRTTSKEKGEQRLKNVEIRSLKIVLCPNEGCGELMPIHYRENFEIRYYYSTKNKSCSLSARKCIEIFKKITNEDFRHLGFNQELLPGEQYRDKSYFPIENIEHIHQNRPEGFIISNLVVSPPKTRPFAVIQSETKHDDITDFLNAVLKANDKIRKATEKGNLPDRERHVKELNMLIWSLIDNSKSKNSGGRARLGVADRMSGKGGQFRGNVEGKRTNECNRTVVDSGSMVVSVGEVGLPEDATRILSTPEYVCPWNIQDLQYLVRIKRVNYIYRRGNLRDVATLTKNFTIPLQLKMGDIVKRMLVDGDAIIHNRQPTLRVESMQGNKIKILEGEYVQRIALAATTSFNADCDGDEINYWSRTSRCQSGCMGTPEWVNTVIPYLRYNYLVAFFKKSAARQPNCGNTLRASTTTYFLETENNTQGNDLGHGKNVKDWAIRNELLREYVKCPTESAQRL